MFHHLSHKLGSDRGIVHDVRNVNNFQIQLRLGDAQVKVLCGVEHMPNIQLENFKVTRIRDPDSDESEA
jgi:hypothetical protein